MIMLVFPVLPNVPFHQEQPAGTNSKLRNSALLGTTLISPRNTGKV